MVALLAAQFAAPPAQFRPMMFWVWNGDVTRERIDADLADMKAKGCGGVFIHPMGEHFRLHDFIEGVSPPYLSDEYFELIRYAVERAAQEGLYAWLYDEGGWPSGTAQGKVAEGHPELRGKVLTVVHGQPVPPEGTAATVALRAGQPPLVVDANAPAPGPDAVILHFVQKEGGFPVDMMDPAAVRRFIDVTHERYRACVGEYFGKTVPGIFTDEPRVGGRVGTGEVQWTPRLLAAFEADHGFDLRPWLPLLFSKEALGLDPLVYYSEGNLAAVRSAFFDTWTRLYGEAYWEQINEWCRQQGLLHVGHVGGEDSLPDHIGGGFGEFFRTAGTLDVPGVDAIWRQLFPGQANGAFPRFASSAAHQKAPDASLTAWPRSGLALSESFGVYGFGMGYGQMKWVTDYQYVRGINVMCPMSYSMHDDKGRLYRTVDPASPGNPMWEHYGGYADYVGRLSAIGQAGESVASIAVWYPVEALWAGRPGNAAGSLEAICGLLEDQQLEYDLVGRDALLGAVLEDELLVTPGAQYELLIVPEVSVLDRSVAEKMVRFRRRGGRLAFLGEGPEWILDSPQARPVAEAAPELLDGAFPVELPKEIDRIAPAFGGLRSQAMRMMLDGIVPAFMGGDWLERFAGHRLSPGVALKVPESGLGPLAQVLGITMGRVRLTPAAPIPGVRLMTRVLEQNTVHLLVNERNEEVACRLSLAAEEPLRLERWDLLTGRRWKLLDHDEVTEASSVEVVLPPFGSATLAAVVPDALDEPPAEPELAISVNLGIAEPPRPVSGVEIRNGEPAPQGALPPVPADTKVLEEGRWDIAPGCEYFSGTMEYQFTFEAERGWLERRVVLELRDVRYAAEVWVNGARAGRALWPPYMLEIAPYLREGANEVAIRVTNTLANQALRPDVMEEAKARGWWNVYCERSEPMMRESLPSGMSGAVRLWLGG
jgi:alpha-L-rhamnosidase/Glycosyl hydrolases family 2, sugar binding domain